MDLSNCLIGNLKEYLGNIKKWTEDIWSTPPIFHFQTKRGLPQANRFIRLLEKVCRLLDPALSQEEVFLLIASVYLHDIGMHCGFNLIEGLEEKYYHNMNNEDLSLIGGKHSLISAQIIRANKTIPPLYNPNFSNEDNSYLLDVISFICSKHKGYLEVGSLKKAIKEKFPHYRNKKTRIPLITALLQLADVFDITKDRLDEEMFLDYVNGKIEVPHRIAIRWWCFYYVDKVEINNSLEIRILYEIPQELETDFLFIKNRMEKRFLRKEGDCLDILKEYKLRFRILKSIPPKISKDKRCIPDDILTRIKEGK